MSDLSVYKASAGSGKTFTLAVEYIKLLVHNPTAYRHILAVTFTNKATGEMKERILCQLYGITVGDKDSRNYLDKICQETGYSEAFVRERTGEALSNIIHDYNNFQVMTIDSFFQTVMRSLARELRLGASLNIELDTNSVLDAAVDKLISGLHIDSFVFGHILNYIEKLIAEDKTWKIIDAVKEFGREIWKEKFLENRESLHQKLQSKEYITAFNNQLVILMKEAKRPLKEIQEDFFQSLSQAGLTELNLKNGARGIGSYFKKLRQEDFTDKIRNATVEKCLVDINEWRTKNHDPALTDQLVSHLQSLLIKAEELRPQALKVINSCRLSLEHIDKVFLLAAIDKQVHQTNEEKNRFLLAETNILLNQLIGEGDSSFVFEKTGADIRHVMIDEFQDTSSLQWRNFRMLLLEGLSHGASSLIVGDVKQAIYRWRGGDWSIMGNIQQHLPQYPVKEKTLTDNYRSEENVILFNNNFFTCAKEALAAIHLADQKKRCHPLLDAYSDVAQNFPSHKTPGKGYVKVSFLDKDEEHTYEEATLSYLVSQVKELVERGIKPNDIAILVRKNRFIPQIANYFERELPEIPVVSGEAYRMDASPALQILIQAIRVLAHPTDLIARTHLAVLYYQGSTPFQWNELHIDGPDRWLPSTFLEEMDMLRTLPLFELLERLSQILELHLMEGQSAYLFAFYDAVAEYLQNNPADYDSFLRYWEERLCAKTIPAGNLDGIRIYSIHNSKGLEFHTVLVPFCNWKMENEHNSHNVWCEPPVKPYNNLELLPIRYGSEMNNSVYKEIYLKERLELWVDNLNILYVAFTRASANLIVTGNCDERSFGISSLMMKALARMEVKETDDWAARTYPSETETENWNVAEKRMEEKTKPIIDAYKEGNIYEFGTLCPSKEKEKKEKTNILEMSQESLPVNFVSHRRPLTFRQSNRSQMFIQGDEETDHAEQYLKQGLLLHRIFSEIHTVEDAEPLLQQMEMEGLICGQLGTDDIKRLVLRALNHKQGSQWFTSEWTLMNERTIISQSDNEMKVRRPDRVMISHDQQKAVVVDFKFGKPNESYKTQVGAYMDLLRKMGYPNVEGYLWYVYTGHIEPVK